VASSAGSSGGRPPARGDGPGRRDVALWIEQLDSEYQRAAASIGIPSCPAILKELADESRKASPDLQRVARLVSKDVGLSAALIKLVNSSFYGLKHKVGTVTQAISLLGLLKVSRTVAGLVLKSSWSGKGAAAMEEFWEASSLVAAATAQLAAAVSGVSPDQAYTFGLFRDCGIALLMLKHADYRKTLGVANRDSTRDFTEAEHKAYGTDHATVGALVARVWQLPEELYLAIRFHHDYLTLVEEPREVPAQSLKLVSLGVLADRMVQRRTARHVSAEWKKGGAAALSSLGLTQARLDELCDKLA
jgi:HD-like signal output (HDOD) protein